MQELANSKKPLFAKNEFLYLNGLGLSVSALQKDKSAGLSGRNQVLREKFRSYVDSNFVYAGINPIEFTLRNKGEILEWVNDLEQYSYLPYALISATDYHTDDGNFIVLQMYSGSGVISLHVFIFKEDGDAYKLLTVSNMWPKEMPVISIDNDLNIVASISSSSRIIGSIPEEESPLTSETQIMIRPDIIAFPEDFVFVVDNMQFGWEQFQTLKAGDCKTLEQDKKRWAFYCTTRLLIDVDGQPYLTNKEKKQLSSVEVKSVERVENATARKLYGRKGRHGALIINGSGPAGF